MIVVECAQHASQTRNKWFCWFLVDLPTLQEKKPCSEWPYPQKMLLYAGKRERTGRALLRNSGPTMWVGGIHESRSRIFNPHRRSSFQSGTSSTLSECSEYIECSCLQHGEVEDPLNDKHRERVLFHKRGPARQNIQRKPTRAAFAKEFRASKARKMMLMTLAVMLSIFGVSKLPVLAVRSIEIS